MKNIFLLIRGQRWTKSLTSEEYVMVDSDGVIVDMQHISFELYCGNSIVSS